MVLVSVWTMGTSLVDISVFWAANVSEIVTISVFTTGGYGETEAVSVRHTYKRRPVWRHKHNTTATQHSSKKHHYNLHVFGITHAAYKPKKARRFRFLWSLAVFTAQHTCKSTKTQRCVDTRCHYIALLVLSILKMHVIYLCNQIISVALLKFLLLYLSTSRAKNQCKRTYHVIMISMH